MNERLGRAIEMARGLPDEKQDEIAAKLFVLHANCEDNPDRSPEDGRQAVDWIMRMERDELALAFEEVRLRYGLPL